MKYTLIDMVQDVLSSMDGDEVNSITDSTEAEQIARIIRACYFDIQSSSMPESTTLYQLEASGTSTKPVLMTLPDDVHSIAFLKCDCSTADDTDPLFTLIKPLSVQDFFAKTHALVLSDDNVMSMSHTIDGDTFSFLYRTDKHPDYFTVIDNHTFLFDSHDSEVDTTLQKSKTMCLGEKENIFVLEDSYEIDLDEAKHVWLLNEAKILAFQELKQQTHAYAERTAKRQRMKNQRKKMVDNNIMTYYDNLPIYGRRGPVVNNAVIMH